jgi:anaerobic magnesium-protoporphyrin IX monomethyl ester cyclase
MRILLTTLNAKYIHSNLAIRILYQLNKNRKGSDSHRLSWKEFTIREDRGLIARECSNYDIVAFSCYIWNIIPTLEVARLLKELQPSVKILLGGPEVSYDYQEVIADPIIDFIIAGEGETAFSAFVDHYPDIQLVPGLIWKDENGIHENPAPPLFDLSRLSAIMPYADDPVEQLRSKVLYIETSRGCPYKCGFCLASLDNKVRQLPDDAIKATLLHLMTHGKTIKFLDRTFNIKKQFTLDIFRFILDNRRPGNIFQFEITADILHPDIISFINAEVPPGLFRFEIGIQSVNKTANLSVSRKQDFEKTKSIIAQVRDKVELHLDLIVGLPHDRMPETRQSFTEVFKLFAPELQLGFLKFLKGTPVREKHAEHGYVFAEKAPYEIIRSNFLSEEELDDIRHLEHALEVYWNGKKAIRTLKYATGRYDIFDFLLGLGKRFAARLSLHQYMLNDVYNVLMEFAISKFPGDHVLKELIAVDYYLYSDTVPELRYIEHVPGISLSTEKNVVKGVMEKTRRLSIPLSFDYHAMVSDLRSQPAEESLVITYSGMRRSGTSLVARKLDAIS